MPAHDDFVSLAGIIDGEGHIALARSNGLWHSLRLSIGSTSFELIEYLKDTFGGSYYVSARTGQYGNNKRSWHWSTSGKNLYKILDETMPYLIIKKSHALLALGYRDTMIDGRTQRLTDDIIKARVEIADKFKQLNARGLDSLRKPTTGIT
jgi:hypothetical protein